MVQPVQGGCFRHQPEWIGACTTPDCSTAASHRTPPATRGAKGQGDAILERESMITVPSVVHSDPDILSGTPVFVGTRVPVQSLFDYLEGGDTVDEFLRQFPSVGREQAIAALELARDSILTSARSA